MKDLMPFEVALDGTMLIEASAGTGKTYTLTTLYLRLLVEHDLLPSEILVVTYTQAATAELRDRVRERIREAIAAGEASDSDVDRFDRDARCLGLKARRCAEESKGPDPLRRALREFDEAAIFTIHGFCQRALGQNAFESGVAFDAELIEAADLLQQELAHDLWARAIAAEKPEFVEWLLQGDGSRWEFKPDSIQRGLLDLLGADEEMPVLPEVSDVNGVDVDIDSIREELRIAWAAWVDAWPKSRERVVAWLLESEDLSRVKYKRETIETLWIPLLEEWSTTLADEPDEAMSLVLPAWWKKLSQRGLEDGLKRGGVALEDPVFGAFEAVDLVSARLAEAYSHRALALRRHIVERAREETRKRRDERHQLVFDDLLSELRSALRPPEGDRLVEQLRAQYRFALIDEFQDTDPVQYEIFRRVWHREESEPTRETSGGLILIGDPKQAIYSFRGADLFTYLSAGRDAGESIYGLGVNYRSDPGVVGAVNELFGRPSSAFGFDAIEFHRVVPRPDLPEGLRVETRSTAGLRVLFAEYEKYAADAGIVDPPEPAPAKGKKAKKAARKEIPLRFGRTQLMVAMARDVAELLESNATIEGRPVQPSDIAVLCRKKVELGRARRAFQAMGIPCVERGDSDVFESREAWELVCVLRAMLRSGDESLLRAALATGALGWNAAALAGLSDDSDAIAAISERFAEYARVWRQSGFMRAFESWRREEGVTKRLLGYIDGERRLTNWLHLGELLQRVESERTPSRSGLANWLERAIADPDVRKRFGADASLLRLESDDQAVSLVTLHRSKGLEYEIVYLPCLWEDASPRGPSEAKAEANEGRRPPVRCHDPDLGSRILDLGGPKYHEHLNRQKDETRSESLRLLYVGLTRAKRQCVVMWGAIGKGTYTSTPLAWLLAASEENAQGGSWKEVQATLRSWTDADWLEAFRAFGAAAGAGGVSVESADWRPRDRWQPTVAAHSKLVFDRKARVLPRARVTTSFSGLTRDAHRSPSLSTGPAVLGRDVDAEVMRSDLSDPGEAADLAAGMDEFPRGADAGTLLHEVLEQVEFSSCREEEVRALVVNVLARHGLPLAYENQILHVVRSVAMAALRSGPEEFRLADLAPDALLSEMEFTLAAPGTPGRGGLTPTSLTSLLAEAPADTTLNRYADRVTRLGWREFEGFLRGFIDAVFFDGEKYYLVDYKSNHLGPHQSDYAPENLVAPMLDHDYVLQYLIYSVALDRHLAQTLEGYAYETHFGGVYYLFLRGIAESHPPGCGIFFDRPDVELIRSVSDLLGTGRAVAT